jgi:hypothetical protein
METPVPPAAPAARPPARRARGTRRVAAIATAAFGAVALGVAAGFALSARSTYDGAACSGTFCTVQGRSARDSAYDQAAIASVAFATGLGAAAGAGILWWSARMQPPGMQAEPTAGKAAWGLSLSGAW